MLSTASDSSEITSAATAQRAGALRRYVPLLVWLVVLISIAAVPLAILGKGYLPEDDALRHAAKAVSGKAWSDVLILADWVTLDHNPGWHALLGSIHRVTGWGVDGLVAFSVAGLFLLYCLLPFVWVRRPEVWMAILLVAVVAIPRLLPRLTYGRPLLVSCSILMFLLFTWNREWTGPKWKRVAISMALFAVATWIHGTWYLFALLVFAFAAARQWRSASWLAVCWLSGSFIGAVLTGHPVRFLFQAIQIAQHCFANHIAADKIAYEFQPSGGDLGCCLIIVSVVLARFFTGTKLRDIIDNAPFILALTGFFLGLRVVRFWLDWGLPALLCWLAMQAEEPARRFLRIDSPLRLATALVFALGFVIAAAPDRHHRWTISTYRDYISPRTHPEVAEWLPKPGGIVYNAQMQVFYKFIYANPDAPWRYTLGFEPALMSAENLTAYERITAAPLSPASFEPWIKKMRPEDAFIIEAGKPLPIPQLEWHAFGSETWIGRLPRKTNSAVAVSAN